MTLETKERIWGQEPYISLVRLVGYAGITSDGLDLQILPLNEKYGEEAVRKARYDLFATDYSKKPHVMTLRPEVRKIVYPILGPDVKDPPWWAKDGCKTAEPKKVELPKKKRRTKVKS
jgi:hypothetical protein